MPACKAGIFILLNQLQYFIGTTVASHSCTAKLY